MIPLARALRTLVCLLAILPSLPLLAQGPEIILKGGLVSSDFVGTGVGGARGQPGLDAVSAGGFGAPGFGGGIALRFDLPGRWALQAEALWLRKAADIELLFEVFPGSGFASQLIDSRVDYLELPLMLRYELDLGDTRPYFMAGPAFAARLGAHVGGETFDRLVGFDLVDPELADHTSASDIVLGLGAGADFGVAAGRGWMLELRASWGLRQLYGELPTTPLRSEIDARSSVFMALAGYRF